MFCIECNWEPVELLQDWSDVTGGWGSGDNAFCQILYKLKFVKGFLKGDQTEGSWSSQAVTKTTNHYGSGIRGEGGA